MIFRYLVLDILKILQKERTISSPYHLLKGKRSGQTIQDVGIFRLHPYFGILPKLSRNKYDEEIQNLVEQHFIHITKKSFQLTEKGLRFLRQHEPLPLNGWQYRGNEHIFFSRLSLIVQSLSHAREEVMSFNPIQKDESVQQWVRSFLIKNHYKSGLLAHNLYDEMLQSLGRAKISEQAKEIVVKRLTGIRMPGFTWEQISRELEMPELDVQIMYVACLHQWLNEILVGKGQYPYLFEMAQDIRVEVPLTESAYHTVLLFRQGYSIEQISRIRKLKKSTIEDHLVELAINDPSFPIERFIKREDIEQVLKAVQHYQSKKLKFLHEALPHLSYFQLRLALVRGETVCN
ncbi:helix-turn-helix domain-containing protein [Ureibacillus sp. FSL K6-8385]|uniref:Recombinase RecQ n=1 Tax=Ureibacillus terrenus TaxID=118246 RepID=A0A540V6K7_9BACL|nr:helix-turn-helix domain-containing protein [Ureibacillus terrenus]MED3660607.1 helix-turn-helix domain-containing protein [Ureibacillus terrenus]MED3762727.1 helix-turn-helix domain-containing protein [Ureibacillus terrenus]TQE92399.1 recombinase RecQ [Ureibacillus terrenus]